MRHPQTTSRRSAARALRAGLVALVALLVALPALAANVIQVRVGNHPTYSRVVFQLDGATGYRVQSVDGGSAYEVTLEASSRARSIQSKSAGIAKVVVGEGRRAVARIELTQPGMRLQEMILANPPRIVLDVILEGEALAKAPKPPAPKSVAKAQPKAQPKAAAKPKPAPRPEPEPVIESPAPQIALPIPTPTPAPEPVAPPAPEPPTAAVPTPAPVAPPEPHPVVAVEPEPEIVEPAPVAPPEPEIVADIEPIIVPEVVPEPEPLVPEVPDAEPLAPEETGSPEGLLAELGDAPPTLELEPGLDGPLAEGSPEPDTLPEPEPEELAEAAPVVPTPRAAVPDSSEPGLLGNPIALGGIAAAAFGLVLIVFMLLRRRRQLPNDVDVTAIAEESAAHGRVPAGGFAMDEAPGEAAASASGEDLLSSAAGLNEDDETDFGLEPAPVAAAATRGAPQQGASLFDDEATGAEPERMGDTTMTQEASDLPADRAGAPPAPPAAAPAAPAAGGSDIARLVQDMERRMGALEAKLEASNEAREKLERQVAAQSEELRVQRAAIARTQRALRSMSRADEDKATEPALRDGDTQVKTRVNV